MARQKIKQKPKRMRFALVLLLKLVLVLSIVLFLALGVSATLLESILRTVFGTVVEKESVFIRLLRVMQWMGFAGTIIMAITFVFVYLRGVNHYQKFYDRVSSILQNDSAYQSPWTISFPTEDVFGNLGTVINQFFRQMAKFDRLKTYALKRLQERFEYVADLCPKPILLLRLRKTFPHPAVLILYANRVFLELFAKKGENDYYDVHGMNLDLELEENDEDQLPTVGQIFQMMYDGEMADSFLDADFIYAVNTAIASTSSVVIKEKYITPLHKTSHHQEPIHCMNIEFRPFFDIVSEDGVVERRETKEVLVIFHEVKIKQDLLKWVNKFLLFTNFITPRQKSKQTSKANEESNFEK